MSVSRALCLVLIGTVAISSCHRKTVPATRTELSQPVDSRRSEVPAAYPSRTATPPPLSTTKPATANTRQPIVVVDSKGSMVVTPEELRASGASNLYDEKNARAFTPSQRKNLINRFKSVPPRVLYVPPGFVKSTSRGDYYILKNKFWYWKKADGYFYLDENYFH